jgi:hypothetical protein
VGRHCHDRDLVSGAARHARRPHDRSQLRITRFEMHLANGSLAPGDRPSALMKSCRELARAAWVRMESPRFASGPHRLRQDILGSFFRPFRAARPAQLRNDFQPALKTRCHTRLVHNPEAIHFAVKRLLLTFARAQSPDPA